MTRAAGRQGATTARVGGIHHTRQVAFEPRVPYRGHVLFEGEAGVKAERGQHSGRREGLRGSRRRAVTHAPRVMSPSRARGTASARGGRRTPRGFGPPPREGARSPRSALLDPPGYTSEPARSATTNPARSRNRSSTSDSVWTRCPRNRQANQRPASRRFSSRTVRARTGPRPFVVRSRRSSWRTTSCSSAVSWTSSHRASAPAATAPS